MKLTIRQIKICIREALRDAGSIDHDYISSEIVKRMEGELDLSQAVTSFLKDNPNITEEDIAVVLRDKPISGWSR